MRDAHIHFTGALAASLAGITPRSVPTDLPSFFDAYQRVKSEIRARFPTPIDMYRQGTRSIAEHASNQGIESLDLIAGFVDDYDSSVRRFAAMLEGSQTNATCSTLLRGCFIRQTSGYANVVDLTAVFRVMRSSAAPLTVDFCGPDRQREGRLREDLDVVGELHRISETRFRHGLPRLSIAMHVGEDITLGPVAGLRSIELAVNSGVNRVAHAHWLWAKPWCEVPPEAKRVRNDLLADLRTGRFRVDVCPSASHLMSNVTGIADDFPIEGVDLGTDNPGILQTTIAAETSLWSEWIVARSRQHEGH